MKIAISPEVEKVVRASAIEGNNLVLPAQLEPKLYRAVNKVLEAAGGKWNKKAKAHVFPSNPMAILGLAVEAGVIVDEVKKKKKDLQAFYTPPEVAILIVDMVALDGRIVLEPSAGHGALAKACLEEAGAEGVVCVDIDPDACAVLRGIRDTATYNKDFLKMSPVDIHGGLFDRIVMNPPFTAGQDIKHLRHARKFLARDGVIACVMPDNTNKRLSVMDMVRGTEDTCEFIPLPKGSFKESGTMVNTMVALVRS
jgi:predicted RNA methylase